MTAFLLTFVLLIGLAVPVMAQGVPDGVPLAAEIVQTMQETTPLFTNFLELELFESELELLDGGLALENELDGLLRTLGEPLGALGFEGAYAISSQSEIVEIVVTLRTPPAVALRLLNEAGWTGQRGLFAPNMARMGFEAQALSGHANFFEQLGSMPVALSSGGGVEIIGAHHTLFNGVYLRVPASMIEVIAALPEVFAVTPNITFYAIGVLEAQANDALENDSNLQYGCDYLYPAECEHSCEYEYDYEYGYDCGYAYDYECEYDYEYECDSTYDYEYEYDSTYDYDCEYECDCEYDYEYDEYPYYDVEDEVIADDNDDVCLSQLYLVTWHVGAQGGSLAVSLGYEYSDYAIDEVYELYSSDAIDEENELLGDYTIEEESEAYSGYAAVAYGESVTFTAEPGYIDYYGELLEAILYRWVVTVGGYALDLYSSEYWYLSECGLVLSGIITADTNVVVYFGLETEYEEALEWVPVFDTVSHSMSAEFNLGALELFDMDYIHNTMNITGVGTGRAGGLIHVAVIDTGVDYYYHPRFWPYRQSGTPGQSGGTFLGGDFIASGPYARPPGHRFHGSPQETGPWDTNATPEQHTNHGTHVAGTVIAMSPGIMMSHGRVLAPGGSVGNSVMAGIEWAYLNGADILNLSLGSRQNISWSPDVYALNVASLAGVFVTNSAGNDGAGGSTPIAGRGGWFSLGTPGTSSLSMTVGNAMGGGQQWEDHPNATINGSPIIVRLHGRNPATPNNSMHNQNDVPYAFFGQIVLPATLDANNQIVPEGVAAVQEIAQDLIDYWGSDLSGYTVITNRGASNFASMRIFAEALNADALIIRNNLAQGDVFLVHPGFSAVGVTGVDDEFGIPIYSVRNSAAESILGELTLVTPLDEPIKGTMSWNAFERTHTDDIIAPGSSIGPVAGTWHLKPDIVAPGSNILSAIPVFMAEDENPELAYGVMSGTSMSAPAIAGIAALMMQQFPNADVAELKARLMQTARDLTGYTGTYSLLQVGAGFVRPLEALQSQGFALTEHPIPWGEAVGVFEYEYMASLSFGRVDVEAGVGGVSEILPITLSGGNWNFSYYFVHRTQTLPTPGGHPGWGQLRFSASGSTLDIQGSGSSFTAQISHDGVGAPGFAEGYVVFTNGSQTLRVPFGVYMDIFVPEPPITPLPAGTTGIWRPVLSNYVITYSNFQDYERDNDPRAWNPVPAPPSLPWAWDYPGQDLEMILNRSNFSGFTFGWECPEGIARRGYMSVRMAPI